jgi:uncharacterized protein GlcG (DUF336 family)
MKQILIPALALAAVTLGPPSAALAQGSVLPGDAGRLGNGIPDMNRPLRPPPPPVVLPPRPGVELALEAAQAISDGCKQYALGVAVVSATGEPVLIYIPDRSATRHGYMAIRKAYSALVFKVATSQMTAKSQTDPELQAQVKADLNLTTFSGGVPLKAGDQIIGAIGVSGAEPGGHDEECAKFGLAKIKQRLRP